jgi:hypothetical protein
MKKGFVSLLLVFFLSFSASSSAADMKETISYAASVTGVSVELLKALSISEAKLLGNLGETLSVISIGQQFYEADDKGVILSILNFAAGKLIDKFCPSVTPFTAGYGFYVASLKVVHDAFWIPTLSDQIYKAYEKQRKQEVIPDEVYIHQLLEPIRADLKAKLITGKYNKESITDWSGQIIPKWQKKIDEEASQILTALLEERYQKKILPELMAEAKKVAEQREKELIEELRDRLYVEVSGTVVKKTEDGTEVVGAAKICVKGKRHCTYSMGNGYFEMKVPYRLLNGDSFQLVCSKAEKTMTSPTIDFFGKLRRRFNINLGKLEEEEVEEEVEIEEEELEDCGEPYEKAELEIGNWVRAEEAASWKKKEEGYEACMELPYSDQKECAEEVREKAAERQQRITTEKTRRQRAALKAKEDCIAENNRKRTRAEVRKMEKEFKEEIESRKQYWKECDEEEEQRRKEADRQIQETYQEYEAIMLNCSPDVQRDWERYLKEREEAEQDNREFYDKQVKQREEYLEDEIKLFEETIRQMLERE